MRAFSAGAKDLEELCVPMRTVVDSLIKSRGKISKRDTELLGQLSHALRASVRSAGKGKSVAHDISETVVSARA